MSGKGDKRIPESTPGAFRRNFDRIFRTKDETMECPACGEIEFRRILKSDGFMCDSCGHYGRFGE